jgi:hypothetical protein
VPEVPRFIRLIAALLSAGVLVSALAGAVLALIANDRPAWTLFGFEAIVAVSCAFGVLLGTGRYREAPGMALACVAGTVFAGSVLGYLSMTPRVLGGIGLTPFLGVRVLAAGLVGALGAYCVLSRHPRSWRLATQAFLLGLPVLGAAALLAVPSLRAMLAPVAGAGVVTKMAVGVGAFLVLGACLCACVDLMIRAFELGRPEQFKSAPGTKV